MTEEAEPTTLKGQVQFVGDVKSALEPVRHNRFVEVRGIDGLQPERLEIAEIALHEDGHVIFYISGRGA